MRAFIFPGQGAQAIGMGKEVADQYPQAMAVFQEVDDALGEKLSKLIWEGDIETLTLTQNAQPALMATSLACMAALNAEGVDVTAAQFVAGHSLGEYSALAAAGSITIADTARLLRIRGLAMQEATPVGIGAMAAILGLSFNTVKDIAEKASQGDVCQAANDNDPSQVVISGHLAAVERACMIAKEAGAKRALMLPVSAPFHCELMGPAASKMAEALDDVEILAPKVPLIANVIADDTSDPSSIRSLLVDQVTGSVRWRESVEFMARHGVTETYEIGSGKALSGMVKRTSKDIATFNAGTAAEIKAIAQELLS